MSHNIHYTRPADRQGKKTYPTMWYAIFALIAGAVFSFALAPYSIWGLALFSPAVLYFCVSQRSPLQALWIGLAFGFGQWFVGGFWLYTSIHVYGLIAAPLAVLMVAIMAFLMAWFTAIQMYLYRRFFPETPLTFAPLWVMFEWLKTWLFTGFPWLFVGYAFTGYMLDEYAPVLGVLGVSFVAVLLASAAVELLRKRFIWVIPSVLVILGAWGIGQIQFVQPRNEAPLTVSLIQGNIDQGVKWDENYFLKTLETYIKLTEPEWGRDLVVWPESAIPSFQTDVALFLDNVSTQAKQYKTTWLTGIFYLDESQQKKYNSVITQGEQGDYIAYHKQRLVPFGEYIPLAGLLYWVLPEMQKDVANGALSAGETGQKPFNIKDRQLAVAICYEVAYPHLTRTNAIESDFLMTVSNDAWFIGTAGPWQHLQMVQMRAKENGRWFIRATNTGITAIINEKGQIVKQAPQDVEAVLRGELYAMTGRTWYNYLSDYPILAWSLFLLILSLRYRK